MKTFERVLFITALLLLNTFAARHAYRLWIEPRGSVLDEFQKPVDQTIKRAKSISDLVTEYRKAKKAADILEKEHENDNEDAWKRSDILNNERQLLAAITDWETKKKEVYEMRVYWCFGLLSIILGTVIHLYRSKWLGLGLLATGFSEMIYWTCPSWRGGAELEYERLLLNKLLFSVIAIGILFAVGWLLTLIKDDHATNPNAV
jgi:hypothetical protein